MFTLDVDVDGVVTKFELGVERASDIDSPLRRFGAHLRKKAVERYKQQGFAPLAASTLQHRAQKGLAALESKLTKDVRRAYERTQGGGPAPRGILQRALSVMGAQPSGGVIANTRGIRNRLAVLSEFQRRHRGQSSLMAVQLTSGQSKSLAGRTARAVVKAVSKSILGQLDRSPKVTVNYGSVTLESRTWGKWSEVHNDGGAAGHGAKIPKRETIKLDSEDPRVLTEILTDHLTEPFED